MGVYLPTGAVGNGKVLCTLGGAGEIMSFFYPYVDYAQNVRQLLSAMYLGDPGQGRFLWCFDDDFERHQEYLPEASVLLTTLRLPEEGVTLRLRDFCPPDTPALVRRVSLTCDGAKPFRGTFLKYCELRIHEITGKQSVSYLAGPGLMVQYCRDIALAVGGGRPDVWRCGKSIDEGPRSAKNDLFDGHLNGQPEDIGQVDFALGWHVVIQPGEAREFDLVIAAAASRDAARDEAVQLMGIGGEELERQTVSHQRAWLGSLRRPTLPADLDQACGRALLTLRMLQDAQTFAVTAAPEFDPAYELCGGYGYCWPRDATEAMQALALVGDRAGLEGLTQWYVKTQLPSGQWGQRYWSEGMMASSWALREGFLQVDQSAAAVIAMCQAVASPPGPLSSRAASCARGNAQERGGTVEAEAALPGSPGSLLAAPLPPSPDPLAARPLPPSPECRVEGEGGQGGEAAVAAALWPPIRRGAQALASMVGPDGWHADACDLWETFCGCFVYTNAALYAALREAAKVAQAVGESELSARWLALCERMKAATLELHNGEHFARGRQDGHLDLVVDSSTLGISEPFGMLSPEVPQERALIETNLLTIERRLNYRMPDGGVGIRRYEGDGYLGGVIGCVNTLWFALVCLQLANSYRQEDAAHSEELRAKGLGYIRFALAHATPTGLLPELIGTRPEYPYWAAPHAWASGLMVKCAVEMSENGLP